MKGEIAVHIFDSKIDIFAIFSMAPYNCPDFFYSPKKVWQNFSWPMQISSALI